MLSTGARIANLRKKFKLTQEEFAQKVGISRASLSHYEKDRREPDYSTINKIADYCEVTTDYLLGRSDDPLLTAKEDAKGSTRIEKIYNMIEEVPEKEREILWAKIEAYVEGLTHDKKKED